MPNEQWNPRYVWYARSHARTPEEQFDRDMVDWPGGMMAGFMIWIGRKWEQFRKGLGIKNLNALREQIGPEKVDEQFDQWLGAGGFEGEGL